MRGEEEDDERDAFRALYDEPPGRNFVVGQRLENGRQRGDWVVEDIRRGGFGVVYVVRRGGAGPRQVLKTFDARFLWSDDDRARFEREALTWVRLDPHPHVLAAKGIERIEGLPCVLSDFAEGGDLATLLADGPLPLTRALRFARHLCDGLGHGHDQLGLVHRDVKPANCLLTAEGILMVTDFGLARAFNGPQGGERVGGAMSVPGGGGLLTAVAGTPVYMAPEQFDPGAVLDTRADVHAFGVVLHQMVTGLVPDGAGRAGPEIRRITRWRTRRTPLFRLILACTDPDRDRRPADFTEVRELLDDVHRRATGETAPAAPRAGTLSAEDHVSRAQAMLQLSHHPEALAVVDDGLALVGPEHAGRVTASKLWHVRGAVLHSVGRYDESLAAWDRAVELNPDEPTVWHGRGRVLHLGMGRAAEGLACFERVVCDLPDDHAGWAGMAGALVDLGRLTEAEEAFARALARRPTALDVLIGRARLHRRRRRPEEALADLDRALVVLPRYVTALDDKADVLRDLERHVEADVVVDRLAEIHRRTIDTSDPQDAASAMNNLGLIRQRRGDDDGARDLFRRAAESGHGVVAPVATRNLARLLARQGDHVGARAAFDRVIASGDPEQAALARQHLADMLDGDGDAAGAREQYRRAIDSGVTEVQGPSNLKLGHLLRQVGDDDAARHCFERAIASAHPSSGPIARVHLGGMLEGRGDLDEAAEQYRIAITTGGRWVVAWASYRLGTVLARQGDRLGARRHLRRAAESDEAKPAAWAAYELGGNVEGSGDDEDARGWYRRALEIGHEGVVGQAALGLGRLLRRSGDTAGAREQLERALASGDDEVVPWALNILGLSWKDTGDLEAACAYFRRAVATGHAEVAPWGENNLGVVSRMRNELDEATSHLERAVAAGTEASSEALLELGLVQHTRGDDAAEATYRRAADTGDPSIAARARANIGRLLLDRGDLDGAEAQADRALEADDLPASAYALAVLGDVARQRDDHEGARGYYERAIRTGDDDIAPSIALRLGVMLREDGDREAALANLTLAADSGHARAAPMALVHRGYVLRLQGDRDGAIAACRAAAGSGFARAVAEAHVQLAVLASDPDEARREYERAVAVGDPSVTPRATSALAALPVRDDEDVAG